MRETDRESARERESKRQREREREGERERERESLCYNSKKKICFQYFLSHIREFIQSKPFLYLNFAFLF